MWWPRGPSRIWLALGCFALVCSGCLGGKPRDTSGVKLRVFFAARGERLILVLSGYDKGVDDKDKRQSRFSGTCREMFSCDNFVLKMSWSSRLGDAQSCLRRRYRRLASTARANSCGLIIAMPRQLRRFSR